MNHDNLPSDHAAAEREWQAQERARLDERHGATTGDGVAHPYRLIARALRQPPTALLPPGFAQRTARQAVQADTRVERYLMRGLVAVFALAAAIVTLRHGQDWLRPVLASVPATWWNNPLLPALLACLGLSGLLGRWPPDRRLY